MSSIVSENNNKINQLIDSTKCWICLNPLFVPTVIKCNNDDHSSMTNICACLPCCRRALKLNKRKRERTGNLRLPCGCSIGLMPSFGTKSSYMYKKIETMYPILNCLYPEVECPNACGFKAKSQKSAYNHLCKDCPNSHVKCMFCNFWGLRKDVIDHQINQHPIKTDFQKVTTPRCNILIEDFEELFLGNLISLIFYPNKVKSNLKIIHDEDIKLLKNISNITIKMNNGDNITLDPNKNIQENSQEVVDIKNRFKDFCRSINFSNE